ncbi:MAG: hypothetical protein RIK87_24025 [Fuerstiella sp.]
MPDRRFAVAVSKLSAEAGARAVVDTNIRGLPMAGPASGNCEFQSTHSDTQHSVQNQALTACLSKGYLRG